MIRWSIVREHLVASWPFLLFAVLPVSLGAVTPHNWWYWPAQTIFLALTQLGCWLKRRRRRARQVLERRIALWEMEHYGRTFEDWTAR